MQNKGNEQFSKNIENQKSHFSSSSASSEKTVSKKERLIFHVDIDAFFAACEELKQPQLKKLPMAVGGHSSRAIITTANYTARKYGIHSAMPVFTAKQLCPELILLPGHRQLYEKKSKEVFAVLRSYTRIIEPASIDEAYMDMSRRPEDPFFLARSIQDEVLEKTGLSISVGIASNKFYAKLASDWKKPHGIFWIRDEEADKVLANLPISKIYGVGGAAQEKLNRMAIYTFSDLQKLDLQSLTKLFGQWGKQLYNFIHGQDLRPVRIERIRKSIGAEWTLEKDVADTGSVFNYIDALAEKLSADMKKRKLAGRTIQLKLKTSDYKNHTRSRSLEESTNDAKVLAENGKILFASMPRKLPFRLVGLSVSKLTDSSFQQMDFLDFNDP